MIRRLSSSQRIVDVFGRGYGAGVRTFLCLAALLIAPLLGCEGEVAPAIEPKSGAFRGGDSIRLHGLGFSADVPMVVYLCQRAVKSVVVESDRLIRFVTPRADEAGACDVTLQFSDGEEIVLRGAFRYREPDGDVPEDIFDQISRGAE